MCLAIPGQILSTAGNDLERTGRVSFGGVVSEVSLAYVPQAQVGDYVVVHVGFAISQLDLHEAEQTLHYLEQMQLRERVDGR
ncbi:HypC/HybG/HupF family hydrogenase formation chaperone [Nodosilinea sp. PGN35]|uniref:HypC/HybG/HupF family hydrogenase formation chaperone n=1 Tax=Nodosilinea sp. PGN35 TaxID=3020489 RepID=UPI0023B29460|nr:HypC/HybG/HupF family hydrogenase formation chaperone [Nodosilinea sp. TSF1-S3]MDF0369711.1 HypC/HybG/HupF family hydrogenase formation chaperone [Nodosilinea sp. TSF1-S3]